MIRRVARPLLLLLLLFVTVVHPLRADDIDEEPKPRLRATDADTQALVLRGLAESPSLRALVDRLEQTDVVVYLKCGRLRGGVDGQLTFVSAVGGFRYVIVQIAWHLPMQRRIATLGHEVQHALEIAAHPSIVDQGSMKEAYSRIGFERDHPNRGAAFDTEAAVRVGERIWKELTSDRNAY
jgi:hypothetical protein